MSCFMMVPHLHNVKRIKNKNKNKTSITRIVLFIIGCRMALSRVLPNNTYGLYIAELYIAAAGLY